MPQPMRPRGARSFSKPPLSADALVDRLEARGVRVRDHSAARDLVRHVGYYRLSPYLIPFQASGAGRSARDGTDLDAVLQLYAFDRALRLLTLEALEHVEVALRAALTDHMSVQYDDPHWYTSRTHFTDARGHDAFLAIVRRSCDDRLQGRPESADGELHHVSALEHYLMTYGDPVLPPSWVAMELLTLGQLERTYRQLASRSDRTSIASSLGLTDPVLGSWLRTYVRVRNVCAHHGRLWNLGLGVYPAIPTSRRIPWLEDPRGLPDRSRQRLYPVLVSLQAVLSVVAPRDDWAARLVILLDTGPELARRGAGIPEGWSDDAFWARNSTTAVLGSASRSDAIS